MSPQPDVLEVRIARGAALRIEPGGMYALELDFELPSKGYAEEIRRQWEELTGASCVVLSRGTVLSRINPVDEQPQPDDAPPAVQS